MQTSVAVQAIKGAIPMLGLKAIGHTNTLSAAAHEASKVGGCVSAHKLLAMPWLALTHSY